MTLVILLSLLATLYGAQLIFNKNFILKFIIITYAFYCASAIYFSLESYKGWPTTTVPEKARVLAIEIEHPSIDSDGAIYVWINPEKDGTVSWIDYAPQGNPPRGIKLPYTEQAAKQYQDAKDQLTSGMMVFMEEGEAQNNEQSQTTGEGEQGASNPANGDTQDDYKVPRLVIVSPDQVLTK